ncbi:hypothetical protein Bca4012_037843 [Brassica carinata]
MNPMMQVNMLKICDCSVCTSSLPLVFAQGCDHSGGISDSALSQHVILVLIMRGGGGETVVVLNSDGEKLSPMVVAFTDEQTKSFNDAFCLIDKDSTDLITKEKLKKVMTSWGRIQRQNSRR